MKVENAYAVLAVTETTDTAAGIAEFANSISGLTDSSWAKLILVINKSDLVARKHVITRRYKMSPPAFREPLKDFVTASPQC